MKKCLMIICLSLLGMVQVQAQTVENINPTAAQDIATVKSFLENLIAGKAEATKTYAHANMKNYGPGVTDSITLDDMIINWTKNQETFTDIKFNWVGASSLLALQGPFKGTHVYLWGNWSGTEKSSGKTATNMFQYTAILHDGKITAAATHYDALSMMQQLGYSLKEAEGN